MQLAGLGHRFVGGAQAGEDARHVLVADRHQDGGACLVLDRRVGRRGAGDGVAVAARQQQQEAHHGGPEAHRDPAEQDHVQHQDGQFQDMPAVVGQHRRHVIGGDDGLQYRQAEQDRAAQRRDTVPAAQGIGRVRLHLLVFAGWRQRRVTPHQVAAEAAEQAAQRIGFPGQRHHRGALQRRRADQPRFAAQVGGADAVGVGIAALARRREGQLQARQDRAVGCVVGVGRGLAFARRCFRRQRQLQALEAAARVPAQLRPRFRRQRQLSEVGVES